jgi:hypothetical protein
MGPAAGLAAGAGFCPAAAMPAMTTTMTGNNLFNPFFISVQNNSPVERSASPGRFANKHQG